MSAITACRSCGSPNLSPIVSLGSMPLANSLLAPEDLSKAEPIYPLDVVFCDACALVQITETVPPEDLFSDYLYFSSFSTTLLKHSEQVVDRLVSMLGLGPESLAAEIASNDGYLLQYYLQRGVPVLGIDPAANVAKVAEERGVRTLVEFFGDDVAQRLAAEGTRADVIHANNVLAHVANLNSVIEGVHTLLKDDGVLVTESPYLRDLVDKCEFDTIYHEHLCYYSVTSLRALFERHGLVIAGIEYVPIHGGSLRLFITRPEGVARIAVHIPGPEAFLDDERERGMDKLPFYLAFRDRVEQAGPELKRRVAELRSQGKSVAGYAAAAKATVLLNYCGFTADDIAFVVDKSPHKQGRTIPGVRIPILGPEALVERRPDATIIFAWNIADEIMAEQAEYRAGGGRFIAPLPEPREL